MTSPSPAARVLVAGDANPDLVLRGDVVPSFGQAEQLLDDAALVIGGSAAITAHGFARLGRPVTLVAAVGKDLFGAQLSADLESAGVDVSTLRQRTDAPTGITVVLSRGDDRAILTRPGAIPSLTAAEVEAAAGAVTGLGHVHVSSFFLQPALAAELPALFESLRGRGLTTSLDTNADPAGAWAGVDAVLPYLDVLLPNRAEVLALGRATDPAGAARRLAAAGPLVVVKDGAAGAFAVDPSGAAVTVPGVPVIPLDSTGAGDTFDAAFLDGWLAGRPLGENLERAVRAGALCVAALGGTVGQPTQSDLDHRRKER